MKKGIINNPITPEYFCPMCPDHYDEVMAYSDILDVFVCSDCYCIIGEVLTAPEEKIDCTLLYRKGELEYLSGKSFTELRKIFQIQRNVEDDMVVERLTGEDG